MTHTKLKIATLIAAGLTFGASSALALDGKVVLDQLVKKGVLTPEEADAMMKKETEKKVAEMADAKKNEKWYDKIKLDGYVQARYTEQLDQDSKGLDVAADKSVKETTGLMIRRGRLKITGDINSRVHLYSQLDFQGSVNSSDSLALQARDLYADFDIDDLGENRVRVGLSKVPFGWSNLQSSQNRLAMERPDALNSAVEGERDYGIYYMWANKESRELFKSLVKDGLKGSGDYGVLTFGAYNGQGLNKPDLNQEPHLVARASYPFKISDQTFEAGVGGYVGKYMVSKSGATLNSNGTTTSAPTIANGNEFRDDRVAATFIMYPQPFGIEAEITCGKGPQLNDARNRIDEAFLWGGYIMANYRIQGDGMEYIPFVRWNYFDGARKFGTNAPQNRVNEIDIGTEIQFGKAWEFTLCYTYTDDRTNTSTTIARSATGTGSIAPYREITGAHRLAAQLQFNF